MNPDQPSPDRGTESIKMANRDEECYLPMTPDELNDLRKVIDKLPSSRQNGVLCRVLESVSHGVNFNGPSCQDMYVYIVQRLPISSIDACRRTYAALKRCGRERNMTKLFNSLVESLLRSLQQTLIDQLTVDDLNQLVIAAPEAESLDFINEVIDENRILPVRRFYTGPLDENKAYQALESAGYGFNSIEDLLECIESKNIEHPGCIKQARVMLLSIFSRHDDLVERQMKTISVVTNRIGYCPLEALPVLVNILRCNHRWTDYPFALACVGNLDLAALDANEFLNLTILLLQLRHYAPVFFKEVLITLNKLFDKVSNSYSIQERKNIQNKVLDMLLEIAINTREKECQLQLVAFTEKLQRQGLQPNRDIYVTLIDNANSVSVINQICGILLRLEEGGAKPDRKLIAKVNKAVLTWYPVSKKRKRTNERLELIRHEQPNVYNYTNRT
ncbi:uncharacterized protein LOC111261500 [Varroa jacobsoni]|uniref:uncharacterized protein LOC111261500 n=1 Tax=Varroa jacobsoni TaxID=62625 RepID=UPI000BF5B03A|nr:uncharacterized protein LOC111261500 [Varroa jacobsoni]XP_022690785.1 uncharacterized protein LOC111261500 [Varroa jacobsoni]XP_022690786.1 uncharacterized protein LOC111261500 [Varroa jacobsoni]XP_022690787.1 uncharacterized protein LOC111261500 [Varroa jacobsoni]XP_022690788.1 uncharacterized protein LOC111261500 [Varroa jacobsoni]XP_022690789.1 uncharacterized protein LOC111261500 [Varroa jacobsoni]XP_022690790.1 uncharacterized protein LOC111261500 [Varroa jacobsoni]